MSLVRSARRRTALGYRAVLRGTSPYNGRARQVRLGMTVIALVLAALSSRAWLAVPLVGAAAVGPLVNYLMVFYYRGQFRQNAALRRVAAVNDRTEGRQQLNLPAYLEIIGFVGLIVTFSWVAVDLDVSLRLIGLLLAVVYTTSVAHGVYGDHTWFNPAETRPPRWHELLRAAAGPSTAAVVAILALLGSWTPDQRAAVLVISALPVVVSIRIWDLDPIMAELPAVVEEERRRGRELVVTETERALTGSLAELEQLAERHRRDAPVLHELAVHASSRLRSILVETSRTDRPPLDLDTLLGPVLTLARAIGVNLQIEMQPDRLGDVDEDLVAWVLQDLVGNAVNADATTIGVRLDRDGLDLVVSVADDGAPLQGEVWKTPGTSSARLEKHLRSLSGSLELGAEVHRKEVVARWSTGADGRGLRERETDSSAARGRCAR